MALNFCPSGAAAEPELGRPPPPPASATRHCPGRRRGQRALYLSPHALSARRRRGRRSDRDVGPGRPGTLRGWAGTLRSAAPVSTPRGRHSRCPPGATPPAPLAPRPASAAPTFAQLGRGSFLPGSTLGPRNVPGESGRGGNRPLNRSLSSLPSLAPAP